MPTKITVVIPGAELDLVDGRRWDVRGVDAARRGLLMDVIAVFDPGDDPADPANFAWARDVAAALGGEIGRIAGELAIESDVVY